MSKTIIGVFNTIDEAEDARNLLIDEGFATSSIDVHSHEINSTSASSSRLKGDDDDEGFMEGIKRFFSNIFGDDDNESYTSHYSEAVRRGHAILSVEVEDGEVDEASALLNRAGAIDLDTKVNQWQTEGYSGYGSSPQYNDGISDKKASIPVVQEELEVGKRTISKGAVRVYSRTVETPVSESVNLREQHAKIERHPVDRPATAADLEAFQEGSIEIQETEEKAVVSKTARVIEEVEASAEESENTETIEDTVRRTEVEVERNNLRNSSKSDKPSLQH